MQVTGKEFFWMQNWAQKAAQKKANANVNPLLKQVQNIMAQHAQAKSADSVTKSMQAKAHKLDRAEKANSVSIMDELTALEQQMFGALAGARSELRNLVSMHEGLTNIMNGTADHNTAMNSWFISDADRESFAFTDFDTYLEENGYQGDATRDIDILNTEWITAENSMGMTVYMLPGQVLVKGREGTLDKVMFEDQVPLYEQWQEEKKEFEQEALKEYAEKKLPQVQKKIDDFPKRIAGIENYYALKRAALIEKLPDGALKDEYLENMKDIGNLADSFKNIEPGDGKEMLSMLQQMMDKQATNTISIGGVANDGFGGRLEHKGLPNGLYA